MSSQDDSGLVIVVLGMIAMAGVVWAVPSKFPARAPIESPCDVTRKASKILEVGGCDAIGLCGVMLENGQTVTRVPYPVKGSYASAGNCPN